MISSCDSTTRILPYGHFLTKVFKDVGVDLNREMDFEAPSTYDTYDDQSMRMMKFEKALNGSWVRKEKRVPAQAQGQGQTHLGVEDEVDIREIEGGVDPQSGYQQREPKLGIPLLQSESLQLEATFSESMLSKPTFTAGPSIQPSFTEPSSRLALTKPPQTEIPPPQAPLAPNHAPQIDLSAQISSLGTRMEKLAMVGDTHFYSMEDRMDQYQDGFTSQFEYLQQRIEHIEDCMEYQHEEMMVYLHSMFPPPPPQP